jgi:hypothetical protein
VSYWKRVRDPALWRSVFTTRLRFAAVALVIFPVGHWIFGAIFPQRASVGTLIAALLFFVVALA